MILLAWKEPEAGFPRQPLPVSAQFVEQLGAEHHVAIFAPLAATDMNHHALGTPPVTHTYIKPSSNQRSTTARVASAAGRLRSSRLSGNWLPAHSHLPKMPFARSRWRGGRFACYAPDVMPQRGAFNCDFRFSLIFLSHAKSIGCRRQKIQFP